MQVGMFGVCNDGTGMQTNYVFNEAQTIGPDGTTSHGPDTVFSLIHHYLDHHSMGEVQMYLHADNCPGQNKNLTCMHYLMWRVATGKHESIILEFMEKGHTKCRCDGGFGLCKKFFRRNDVDSMAQIGEVINRSARTNQVQFIVDPTTGVQLIKWYGWKEFFKPSLKKLEGISKSATFRFSKDDIGMFANVIQPILNKHILRIYMTVHF